MVLLRTAVVGIFLITVSSALNPRENCEDCKLITKCKAALDLAIHHKTTATEKILRNAHCGFVGDLPKICCTDFMVLSRSSEIKDIDDEIDSHTNLHLLSEECGDIEGSKIMGGVDASLYEFPWLVIVIHRDMFGYRMNCGGSLINTKYVLTAAHCVKDLDVAKVRIREYDININPDCTKEGVFTVCESYYQEVNVSEQIHHENYARYPVLINDIALLRLNETVDLTFKNAGLVCLPVTRQLRSMDIYGERATVAGWGLTETHMKSNVLLKVDIPIFSPRTCSARYHRSYRAAKEAYNRLRNTFCAGELGRDSCKGDSGGPLMLEGPINETYKFIQFGIVSFGNSECGTSIPGVYTDVRKYMKWILDNIRP